MNNADYERAGYNPSDIQFGQIARINIENPIEYLHNNHDRSGRNPDT